MKFSDLMEKFRFDKRLVDWNVNNGVIERTELEKHLSALQDSSQNTIKIRLDDEDHNQMN